MAAVQEQFEQATQQPPQQQPRKANWWKRGVLIVVGAGVLMVGGLGAASRPKEPARSSASAGRRWASRCWDYRAALWIAKPQLAALIMAAAGVAIVFSISMFAAIARPLFLVAALLGRVRQEAQGPPRTQEAPSGESPVGQ